MNVLNKKNKNDVSDARFELATSRVWSERDSHYTNLTPVKASYFHYKSSHLADNGPTLKWILPSVGMNVYIQKVYTTISTIYQQMKSSGIYN